MRATPCNGNHGERGFRQDCQSNCQHLNEVAFSLIVLSENKLLLLCQFHIEFHWIPCTVFLHLHTCKNRLKDLPRQKCQSSRWWACSQLDDHIYIYIYIFYDWLWNILSISCTSKVGLVRGVSCSSKSNGRTSEHHFHVTVRKVATFT